MSSSHQVSFKGVDSALTRWIDTCCGIRILSVVLGHCNPPFRNLIYAFHMPLFFILSGYLYKEGKPVADYGKRMLRRYITPYFILCFINLLFVILETDGCGDCQLLRVWQ